MLATQLRRIIGQSINGAIHATLSARWFPLTRYVPPGISWHYDVQRASQSREAETIFDVGANTGQTVRGLVSYFPSSKIYCFEPIAATMAQLKQKFGGNALITFVQAALGSEETSVAVALHQDTELNTLTNVDRWNDLTGQTEIVSVNTLDRICEVHSIRSIDILKMDVQGWELKVLAGAERMLKTKRIHFVLSEVCFSSAEDDMQYFPTFHQFIESKGFVFCGLYEPFRWGAIKAQVYFANALYMNKSFSK